MVANFSSKNVGLSKEKMIWRYRTRANLSSLSVSKLCTITSKGTRDSMAPSYPGNGLLGAIGLYTYNHHCLHKRVVVQYKVTVQQKKNVYDCHLTLWILLLSGPCLECVGYMLLFCTTYYICMSSRDTAFFCSLHFCQEAILIEHVS